MNCTIPAVVSRRLGSGEMSEAEGSSLCPRSSKKDVNVLRISPPRTAASLAAAPGGSAVQTGEGCSTDLHREPMKGQDVGTTSELERARRRASAPGGPGSGPALGPAASDAAQPGQPAERVERRPAYRRGRVHGAADHHRVPQLPDPSDLGRREDAPAGGVPRRAHRVPGRDLSGPGPAGG